MGGAPGPIPTAPRAAAIARSTRLTSSGPGSRPVTWSVSSPVVPEGATVSTSCSPSGTKTEWRSWNPSSRRPTTASVRFSFAGASRTTGVWCAASVTRRAGRAGRAGWGPSASRSASHSPTAKVCGRRSGAMPVPASAASTRVASNGNCRESTLWIIFRRSRKAAWTSRQSSSSSSGPSRSSGAYGSTTMTAESTAGSGSNASGGHEEGDARPGVVLHEDRQVAHLPGRRGDPLGDLALDHQHHPPRPRRLAEERMQDRRRDVVRQVRDHVIWRGHEPGELLVERVALDQPQLAVGDLRREPVADERREADGRARLR